MNRTGLAFVLVIGSACMAETHKLPVTADVGICAHPKEKHVNTGSRPRVRVKGNEHYYLFDFDASKLSTLKVTQATLHVKLAKGHLREVAFCTVPCEWVEGTADYEPQKGASCFTHVRYPTHTWPVMGSTRPPGRRGGDYDWAARDRARGGTMRDATFNSPHMRWETSAVEAGEDGWLAIPIDPELVQAVAAGLSHGLVMSEEKGQTRENHDIFTREQADAAPYLTVEARPVHLAGMMDRPAPQIRELADGRVEIDASWPTLDGKPLGHRIDVWTGLASLRGDQHFVTFSDPAVVTDGLRHGHECTVWATSFIGPQLHESDKVKLTTPAEADRPLLPRLEPRQRMQEWRMGDWSWWIVPPTAKVDPTFAVPPQALVAGAAPLKPGIPVPVTPRNAWVGMQVVLYPPKGVDRAEDVSVRVAEVAAVEAGRVVRDYRLFGRLRTRVYRTWYVPKEGEPHAEVLVPLTAPLGPMVEREPAGKTFDIPWAENKVEGQANAALFVDVYVPVDVRPGRYNGRLVVSHDGKDVMDVPLAVEVAETVLPDELRVIGDMNTYGSPARAMGVKWKARAAFFEMERKYYRLAHAHRMTLNVLPYSQSGQMNHVDSAPEVFFTDVPRGELPKHVGTNWEGWLDRYGPLLDGSAFSKKAGYVGPGRDTPIHHMYLPFHENWTGELAEHFRPWPPPKDYDAFLKWTAGLPPIEECLHKAYAHKWHTTMQGFGAILDRMGWTDTRYQVYLNNKHTFRKDGGRGTSLWLLDEPMHPDDFRALAYFGRLTAEGALRAEQSGHKAKMDFRIDISRPTHQRQWLDGLVDLNVCADQLYEQRRLIDYRKRRFGEEYWNYNMPESFSDAGGLPWAVWPVRSYCWGATGTLPWQTVGSDGDLREADATALMYPGRKLGLDEPIPSLRMKAWREGLQVAELLRMLREQREWTDAQLRAFVGQVCGLDGWKHGRDPKPDDPIVTFEGLGPDELESLKYVALMMLASDE